MAVSMFVHMSVLHAGVVSRATLLRRLPFSAAFYLTLRPSRDNGDGRVDLRSIEQSREGCVAVVARALLLGWGLLCMAGIRIGFGFTRCDR